MNNAAMWLSYAALQGVLRTSSKNAYNTPSKGIIVYTLNVPVELDAVRDYILEEHSAASDSGARAMIEKIAAIAKQRMETPETKFPKIYFTVSPRNFEDPYVLNLFEEIANSRASGIIAIVCAN